MARTFSATTLGEPFELSAAANNPSGSQVRMASAANGYVVVTWPQGGSIVARVFDGTQWSASIDELAETGSAPIASTAGIAAALALLVGAALLVATRRRAGSLTT